MNLKKYPKEIAYVKFILPRTLQPYKRARRNNRATITCAQVNGTTGFKSPDCIQCNLVDTVFGNSVARFTAALWIYHKFRLWCAQNLFENILKALATDTNKYLLVHQAIGVSRGGKNTKIHALVTENFQLIGLLLTGGHIHDSECAIERVYPRQG